MYDSHAEFPRPMSSEKQNPQKLRSEQECSLDKAVIGSGGGGQICDGVRNAATETVCVMRCLIAYRRLCMAGLKASMRMDSLLACRMLLLMECSKIAELRGNPD